MLSITIIVVMIVLPINVGNKRIIILNSRQYRHHQHHRHHRMTDLFANSPCATVSYTISRSSIIATTVTIGRYHLEQQQPDGEVSLSIFGKEGSAAAFATEAHNFDSG